MEGIEMAGHWIKWEKGLVRKAKVIRIARLLHCTPQHAAACCMQVWEWAEDQTIDGSISGLDVKDVSAAVGIEGIGEAMSSCGWIEGTVDGIALPHWERHNAEPSKARALDSSRKRLTRMENKRRELSKRLVKMQ
jgi:hypothetical protein